LQPTRRRHRQPDKLRNDGPQAFEPQSFLEARENVLFLVGFDVDDAVWMQASLRQSRREQIGSRQTPKDLSFGPRDDTGNEQRRCCAVNSIRPTARNLMQRAHRQPTARQPIVDLIDAEIKHLPFPPE
jgi:hypothetical protein